MKIMFLNKAPRNAATYDVSRIEALLNGYASPGTEVELCFPDDFPGSRICAQEYGGGDGRITPHRAARDPQGVTGWRLYLYLFES